MNKNLTSITYILDRSGSMDHLTEPAISGFNAFVADQLDSPGDAVLSLALFDHAYKTPYKAVPIQEVRELTTKTFVPRGMTALLDAIGRTIVAIDKRLAAQAKSPAWDKSSLRSSPTEKRALTVTRNSDHDHHLSFDRSNLLSCLSSEF